MPHRIAGRGNKVSEAASDPADFSPHDADDVAADLRRRNILVKPLGDERLGPGYMRVTTARPAENERVVEALSEIL